MSYRKIMIDQGSSMYLELMKTLYTDYSENDIVKLGLSFAVIVQLAVELGGEVTAKFGEHAFDLKDPKNISVLIKDALVLLGEHEERMIVN